MSRGNISWIDFVGLAAEVMTQVWENALSGVTTTVAGARSKVEQCVPE